jgi:fucose 4-O-acetylase-like acetyltransferase
MSIAQQRIEWIDIAKGIAIILVVLGHTLSSSNALWSIIYSFHMPLFFLLAGFTFKIKDTPTVVKTSALRLLVPYVICYVLITLASIIWQATFDVKWFVSQLTAFFFASAIQVKFFNLPAVGIIWFFWALFLSRVWLNIVLAYCNKRNVAEPLRFIFFFGMSLIGGIVSRYMFLPLALDLVMATTFFMYLGYLIKQKELLSRKKATAIVFPISLIIWILCLLFVPYSMDNFFMTRLYGNPLAALSGTLICIYVSMFISRFVPLVKSYLLFMGTNSIMVFFLHAIGGNLITWRNFAFIDALPYSGLFAFLLRMTFISLFMYLIASNPVKRSIHGK